jgi:putative ABC transport system permease protein
VRLADLIRTALGSLNQHKLRNTLTLLGVIIGTFVLVLSLSIGLGVHTLVMDEFRKHDHLRKISVNPAYKADESEVPPKELKVQGTMSDEKRERIRHALLRRWSRFNVRKPRVPLTQERMNDVREIPHVQAVVPFVTLDGTAKLGEKMEEVRLGGGSMENENYHRRLVAGEYLPGEDSRFALVSEFLLYRLGFVDDQDVSKALGQKIRVESRQRGQAQGMMLLTVLTGGRAMVSAEESQVLQKVVEQLPGAVQKLDLTEEEKCTLRKTLQKQPSDTERNQDETLVEEFTIVGIVREMTPEDAGIDSWMERFVPDADVIVPLKTAEDMAFRSHAVAEHGLDGATVIVDNEEHLREVTRQIDDMGLNEFSLVEVADNVRRNILLLGIFTGFIAFVALVVASLGITNTMLMSILERTHEIGVMKAVGARDRHIQFMFLIEGGLIGVVGGLLGLLVSWLTSFPGDSIARTLIEQQTRGTMEGSVFAFPLWLTAGIPLFACLVTTLAAAYPARRAARVDPIMALRHE